MQGTVIGRRQVTLVAQHGKHRLADFAGFGTSLIAALAMVALMLVAGSASSGEDEDRDGGEADPADEVRELIEIETDLLERNNWFTRGLNSLILRSDPGLNTAARGEPVSIDAAFLPYAGLRIRNVWILGREAFGTLEVDSSVTRVDEPEDALLTRAAPLGHALNLLATETKSAVVRAYLLFEEGDVIDPFALADSERLLRQRSYTSDVEIEVLPVDDEPGWADVTVLVRDRFPIGAKARVSSFDRYNAEVYHRNIAGIGLNLEYEVPVDRAAQPVVGHRLLASIDNVFGSFISLSAQTREGRSLEEDRVAVNRDFVHPNIHLVGGALLARRSEKTNPQLPEGTLLQTRTIDPWLGWGFRLSDSDVYGRSRMRLIPAVRVTNLEFLAPPRQYATDESQWRDSQLYLGQLTFQGLDYYTTRLVNSYGVTEDIPSGMILALTGGLQSSEFRERGYSGFTALLPHFNEGGGFRLRSASLAGFWRNGDFEDGVLSLNASGFSSLRRTRRGDWRHFYSFDYALGINRLQFGGLRLDELALRDLDADRVTGDQRLTAEYEAVVFTRLALLGFRAATFGYLEGGFISRTNKSIFDERLALNVGVGLRLNNPRLVIPTMELRAGYLTTPAGEEFAVKFRMGTVELLKRDVPSPLPELYRYR